MKAAKEVENGIFGADLGGGVIKKRIALDNKGKSGGARTVIFFRSGTHVFFADGWAKSNVKKGRKEIEDDILETYKDLADMFLNYSETDIAQQIKHGLLSEVKNNEVKE